MYIYIYIYIYISADPALAKAGAAPGTTAGVELFFPMLCTFHEPPRP